MHNALTQFKDNVQHVRNLRALYAHLTARTTKAIDLSDLLRTQLVMLVSAMDHFVHELARRGMLEVHAGIRAPTDAYLKFAVTLGGVQVGLADPAKHDWLNSEILNKHGHLSFQHPDKIADAVRLVSSARIWERVSKLLGNDIKSIKRHVELIVDRRNKIAHEADADPSTPGARWPIDEVMVDDAVAFVEQLCEAIYSSVK